MSKPIYLDYAATTPVHPDVLQEMLPYFTEKFSNASTLYRLGNEAREAVETARQKVAVAIGAQADEIYFTSGATESDNWAIIGAALAHQKKGKHIITTAIEHHAVLDTCKFLEKQGWRLTVLPVDQDGLVDPADVSSAITDETVLISVMHSNNEIGVIEPVSEIGAIARNKDILFHTDATQSVGKVPVNVDELNVDLLALSGHKIYGPKGVGALYVRKGIKISPYMHGGGQEKRKRAGTHNVPGIVGLGKAAEIAVHDMALESARLEKLRDKLINGILERIPHSRLNGHPTKRLPNNVNVCIAGVEGESMILLLDHEGICASSGSACTSGDLTASHVLLALGIPHELAHGSLRLTLGRDTTEADVDRVLEVLPSVINTLRAMSPVYEQT
ncbi:MAG: cysteine desulfurase NifS [Armatimonadetes bacterium]|nr:cysteine desulfurase NifS [Armatimonadota bacterium]